MNLRASREGGGVLLLITGGVFLTIWNLGTEIDLSAPSITFLNPFFAAVIVLMAAGILVFRSSW